MRLDACLVGADELDAAWRSLHEAGEAKCEHKVIDPDGAIRSIECSYRALSESNRYLCVARDTTDRRLLEARVMQAEKIESVGRLAGGIAHDFNNLLTAILGYTELLLGSRGPEDPDRSDLEEIQKAGQRAAALTQQLLAFSRKQVLQPVTLDLNQLVTETAAMLRPLLGATLPVVTVPSAAPVPVVADRTQLEQVLLNLALNARDAMPDGGTLTIASRDTPTRQVRVTVADTGVGMPETVRQRIFEPFYSTKGEAGSGLGLSMAYSIVRRHGGEIHVDSEPGAGTTFTLTFPVAREPVHPQTPSRSADARRQLRVLVVDDNPQVLSTLGEMMRSSGHTVTPNASAPTALRDYASTRFDVVVTNVGMAEMNGWEFAERLRAVDARVPLLFITGWGLREEDHARLAGLGVRRCLFKPIRPDELDAALQDAVTTR
jgi:signal transduction histidine kinase/CheY-like chemotaxis protein